MPQVWTLAGEPLGALSGVLPRGTDPKSQIILSRNPRIVARFGKFLWLSEDLVCFYFEKQQLLESLSNYEVWLWLMILFLVTSKIFGNMRQSDLDHFLVLILVTVFDTIKREVSWMAFLIWTAIVIGAVKD
jgi:hypothetical protein